MKKYLVIFVLEVEAKNIEDAEELADCEEARLKASLKIIKSDDEEKEWFDEQD